MHQIRNLTPHLTWDIVWNPVYKSLWVLGWLLSHSYFNNIDYIVIILQSENTQFMYYSLQFIFEAVLKREKYSMYV